MITHHPDDNLLTEYASGSLETAVSIVVCAHVQTCSHCRMRVEQLNKLGATILAQAIAESVQAETFEHLMARIRSQGETVQVSKPAQTAHEVHASYASDPMLQHIPKVLTKLLPRDGKLNWEHTVGSLKTAHLTTGQQKYEVVFQRMNSGGKIIEHDHRGLEVTLVLHGSFSDEDGIYREGDFLVRTPGEVHRPIAQHQDCLCISVMEAPVKVTGFLGKLINPFLGFKPA